MLKNLYHRFRLKYETHKIQFITYKESIKIFVEHEVLDNLIID